MSYAVLKVQRVCMLSSYLPVRKLVLPVSLILKNATKYKLFSSPIPLPHKERQHSIHNSCHFALFTNCMLGALPDSIHRDISSSLMLVC